MQSNEELNEVLDSHYDADSTVHLESDIATPADIARHERLRAEWEARDEPPAAPDVLTDRQYAASLASKHAPLTFFKMVLAILLANLLTGVLASIVYSTVR